MESVILPMSLDSQCGTGASQHLVRTPHQSKTLQRLPISGLDLNQTLKQAELEPYVSTLSRTIQKKRLPRGVFSLRHLFSTALSNAGEQTLSAHAVRKYRRYLLTHEDATAPLSDAAPATTLAGEDIPITRRTVTEYREAFGFASIRERKRPAHATTPGKEKHYAQHDHRSSSGNHPGPEDLRQHQAGTS
jgi:DNA-directed RNA polymerase specialized sigma54-like protein